MEFRFNVALFSNLGKILMRAILNVIWSVYRRFPTTERT